ncbi:MAG: helicase-related protein [Polyangiaceae bacterium]
MKRRAEGLRALPGIGPKTVRALAPHGIVAAEDVPFFLPRAYLDAREPVSVSEAIATSRAAEERGEAPPVVAVRGTVKSANVLSFHGRRRVQVSFHDERCSIFATWFFAAHGVKAALTPGREHVFVGTVAVTGKRVPSMVQPALVDATSTDLLRPRYPRVGLSDTALRKAVAAALAALPENHDPVPPAVRTREAFGDLRDALARVHGAEGRSPDASSVRAVADRLAWVKAFATVRDRLDLDRALEARPARAAFDLDEATRDAMARAFGFAFTADQARALQDLADDFRDPRARRRLVLGDVGTGKTAVALTAACAAWKAGAQVAIVAPTAILAEQYRSAATAFANVTGSEVLFLSGSSGPDERKRVVATLARGTPALVVGTHALLGDDLRMPGLGLVVVDEEQRFGVGQRFALVQRATERRPFLLTCSATPIPRTLASALGGDLPISRLTERPLRGERAGTRTILRNDFDDADLATFLRRAVSEGGRAFVVAAHVDDDGRSPGVESRAARLARDLAPIRVGMVHGSRSDAETSSAMAEFRSGDAPVLVGTTVLEIGVDVPEATTLVVFDADRFGLSQLHQLRGRVGRGTRASTATFVADVPASSLAGRRLHALAASDDGFALAELDLVLRGEGEKDGQKQSGRLPPNPFEAPAEAPWLARLEDDVKAVLGADPDLALPEHAGLRAALGRLARSGFTVEDP